MEKTNKQTGIFRCTVRAVSGQGTCIRESQERAKVPWEELDSGLNQQDLT